MHQRTHRNPAILRDAGHLRQTSRLCPHARRGHRSTDLGQLCSDHAFDPGIRSEVELGSDHGLPEPNVINGDNVIAAPPSEVAGQTIVEFAASVARSVEAS